MQNCSQMKMIMPVFIIYVLNLAHCQEGIFIVSNELESKFQMYDQNWRLCGQFNSTINQAPVRSVQVLESDTDLQVFWINRENSGTVEVAKISLGDVRNVVERQIDFKVSETVTDLAIDKKGDNLFMTSSSGELFLGKIEEEIFTKLSSPPKSEESTAASVCFDSSRRLLFHVICSKDQNRLLTFDVKEMKVIDTVQVPECLFYLDVDTMTNEIFGSSYENIYKLSPSVVQVEMEEVGMADIRSFGVATGHLFFVNDPDATVHLMDRKTKEWRTIENLTHIFAPTLTFYEGTCLENVENETSQDKEIEPGSKPVPAAKTKTEIESTAGNSTEKSTTIDKNTNETYGKHRNKSLQETTTSNQQTTVTQSTTHGNDDDDDDDDDEQISPKKDGPPLLPDSGLIQNDGKRGNKADTERDTTKGDVAKNGTTKDGKNDTSNDTNPADEEKNLLKDVPAPKDPKPPQKNGEPQIPPLNLVDESTKQNDAPTIKGGEKSSKIDPNKELGNVVKTETKSVGGKKAEDPKLNFNLIKAASSSRHLKWSKAPYFVFILRYLF